MFYGNTSLTNINNSCVVVSKLTIVLLFVVAVTKGPKKKMLEEEERDLMGVTFKQFCTRPAGGGVSVARCVFILISSQWIIKNNFESKTSGLFKKKKTFIALLYLM